MQKQTNIRILVTPDKFRGSLNATEVCQTVEDALLQFQKENKNKFELNIAINKLQLADGGEGSLQTIQKHLPNLSKVQLTVKDPLIRPIQSYYLVDYENRTAYIEMAKVSGLSLLDLKERNPLKTTTFGVGQMILDALYKNLSKIYLFIGGSATNDAGIGMASALNFKFLDHNGEQLTSIGENLSKIHSIREPQKQLMQKILITDITVVSDVQNVFYGPNGAAYVYGPQKGADQKAVEELDNGLQNINKVFRSHFQKDLEDQKGSGAAGGLGGGALLFLKAKIQKGIQKVMQMLNYEKKIKNCDIVITGQGKLDSQSLSGKVVSGVINQAKNYDKEVWILCGINELNAENQLLPIYSKIRVVSLVDEYITQDEAIKNCRNLIKTKIKIAFDEYLQKRKDL